MKPSPGRPSAHPVKQYPTIAVCGLDCGLCPRYYTVGQSRCPGCAGPGFHEKRPSCSFITCCVKKKNLEVCAQCPDFPCPKFKNEEEYLLLNESSSYPPYKKVMPNLKFIRDFGIEEFMKQQNRRIGLLQVMIANFDDGRSRSFFCRATALLEPGILEKSLDKANRKINEEGIAPDDVKTKARLLKAIIHEMSGK